MPGGDALLQPSLAPRTSQGPRHTAREAPRENICADLPGKEGGARSERPGPAPPSPPGRGWGGAAASGGSPWAVGGSGGPAGPRLTSASASVKWGDGSASEPSGGRFIAQQALKQALETQERHVSVACPPAPAMPRRCRSRLGSSGPRPREAPASLPLFSAAEREAQGFSVASQVSAGGVQSRFKPEPQCPHPAAGPGFF